jgi:hypothetical protein
MIGKKNVTRHAVSSVERLEHLVLMELPAWQLLVLAALAGTVFARRLGVV